MALLQTFTACFCAVCVVVGLFAWLGAYQPQPRTWIYFVVFSAALALNRHWKG